MNNNKFDETQFKKILESISMEDTLIKGLEVCLSKMTTYQQNKFIWDEIKKKYLVKHLEKLKDSTPDMNILDSVQKGVRTVDTDLRSYDNIENFPISLDMKNYKDIVETASLNVEGSEILQNFYKRRTKEIIEEYHNFQIMKEFDKDPLNIMKKHMT